MINVQVEKNSNESPLALLRRFNKRVQGARIMNKFKENRFKERTQSKFKKKTATLKRIVRRSEVDRLIRLGKMEEKTNIRKRK